MTGQSRLIEKYCASSSHSSLCESSDKAGGVASSSVQGSSTEGGGERGGNADTENYCYGDLRRDEASSVTFGINVEKCSSSGPSTSEYRSSGNSTKHGKGIRDQQMRDATPCSIAAANATPVPNSNHSLLQQLAKQTTDHSDIRPDNSTQNKLDAPRHYHVPETAPSDTASNPSSDYGEFPYDLAQLISTQTPSIKEDSSLCNGNGCKSTEVLDSVIVPLSETEPELCDEQKNLIDLIMFGVNVFYTGSAGSGESTVLRAFFRSLRSANKRIHVLAYTGSAALQAGEITIHSYAGWTPNSLAKPIKWLKRDAHTKKSRKRFNATNVLVMDEISMVENHLLERLNRIMKSSRGDDRPFGGVQVIVTGDFFQLAPVKPFKFCMECGTELICSTTNKRRRCSEPKGKRSGFVLRDCRRMGFLQ